MYGFVYIWRDRLTKQFYIGSHKGRTDDGYICSSVHVGKQYKLRPTDFKRRILCFVSSREEQLIQEQRWLDLIPRGEFGRKYYNISASVKGFILLTPEARSLAMKKAAKTKKDRGLVLPPRTKEQREHMSRVKTGVKLGPPSKETVAKISKSNTGKTHSEETKAKISAKAQEQWSNEENRRAQSERLKGKLPPIETVVKRAETKRKNAKPGWSRDSRWVTDGVKDVQLFLGDIPPKGFSPGRSSLRRKMRGIWITNGHNNLVFQEGDSMPPGFRLGRVNRKVRADKGVKRKGTLAFPYSLGIEGVLCLPS